MAPYLQHPPTAAQSSSEPTQPQVAPSAPSSVTAAPSAPVRIHDTAGNSLQQAQPPLAPVMDMLTQPPSEPVDSPTVESAPSQPENPPEVATTEPPQSLPTLHTSESPPRGRTRSLSSGSRTPPQGKKRIRVSQRNPKFGFVEGAMMGTGPMKLPRLQDARPPQTDLAKAKKRFNRVMGTVISRAERLAEETDCWLIVIGQQPGEGPALHYTSSRLRREARNEATAIVDQFQQLTYALNLARTQDALQLQSAYEDKIQQERDRSDNAKKTAEAAQQEVRRITEDAEKIREENGANMSLIAKLRAELDTLRGTQTPG
ncbi:hypothetical protein NLJ89_g8131 [Agrocybe chaxingu]|uniref:Uncharacterized protein n=1 Tax=Agrocybe chaxingu TaxID=84603 RepID=A0A9W8K2C1_9AGAR|nr:hypothetical protein NLJ89_g8131 [Agrocybe chaxingu]